ncbi:MAG: iron-containing alcohol dehydrogenase [Acidimicrobiales bacterium]
MSTPIAHDADGIVGVGGGAALDVAKAVGLMATHEGRLFDYEDELPGARPVEDRIPHLVALPTTAGTGSEVGRSAVIADDATHIKKIIFSPHLLAVAVYADPELTVGLPAPITAATGLDALTHNIEAYLAKDYHPICDGIALEGLRLGAANLHRAVANPTDLEARGGMLMSSMMGAIAFQKGLGLVHSTAHALGTAADLHHGLANGVMIDHALATTSRRCPSGSRRWRAPSVSTMPHRPASCAGSPSSRRRSASRPGWRARTSPPSGSSCWPSSPKPTPATSTTRPVTVDDFRLIFDKAFSA